MAVSIKELLAKKTEIEKSKNALYDFETSIGTITVRKPDRLLLMDAFEMEKNADEFLIVQSVIEPNLKDSKLLEGFKCVEPIEIVNKLFEVGEVRAISTKIIELVGSGKEISATLHDDVKN